MRNISAFLCPRCAADPKPADFGSPRSCAFALDGSFNPDNWNCASIGALLTDDVIESAIRGCDEAMEVIPAFPGGEDGEEETYGWIVLTRYKRRGRTSSAIYVGDFYPPTPVTFALVDRTIAALAREKAGR